MADFGTITRGRLNIGAQNRRLSSLNQAQLTQTIQQLIHDRIQETQRKHAEEGARRRQHQQMAIGAGLGLVGGLFAAPFAAAALPALGAGTAAVAGAGLGAASGASLAGFGQNLPAAGLQYAETAFGALPVDWGDVLNGKVFSGGMVDPYDIPADALGTIPGGAGVEIQTGGGMPMDKAALGGQPKATGVTEPASAESPLGAAFERPDLARAGRRRLALAERFGGAFAA